jgi:hypothetical protein
MLGPMRTLAVVALLALCAGCSAPAGSAARRAVAPPASPSDAVEPAQPALARNQARVEGAREIGPYLEAKLHGRGGVQSFVFVASEACRRVLANGALVRLTPAKPLVRVDGAGGSRCGARGLSGLAAWRDTMPTRRASFLVVTAPAELALVGESAGFLIAQGKLPLATELRWPNPLDLAALLPDTPACREHLARGRTEMEFRPRGDEALLLRGRLDACPVLAIAEPVFLQ